MSDLSLDCEGLGAPLSLNPEVDGHGTGYRVRTWREHLGASTSQDEERTRWEVAVSVDRQLLASHACRLRARAAVDTSARLWSVPTTTTPAASPDDATVFPYVTWDLALGDGTAERCGSDSLGDDRGAINVTYSNADAAQPVTFEHRFSE